MSERLKHSLALLLVLVFATAYPERAAEPYGHVLLEPRWAEESEPRPASVSTGERLLRLVLTPAVSLAGARVTWSVPNGVAARSLVGAPTPPGTAGAAESGPASAPGGAPEEEKPPLAGTPSLRIGDLSAGRAVVLEFAVTTPASGGGIGSFTIEATDGAGRLVREAVGFAYGVPGTPGVIRDGAIELPARILRQGVH